MQSQPANTLPHQPLTGDPPLRRDLRLVQTARSRRRLRTFGVATALLVATGGYVHFCLYRHGYRTIPKIGVGFLLQVVTSAVVVGALLSGPHRVGRVAHISDRLAGALTELTAVALAGGTLAAFALTRLPGGLFNFQERGLQPAPQALIALVAEAGVVVVVGAWVVAEQMVQRRVRGIPAPV